MEKEQIIKALDWCSSIQLCCLCPVGKERGDPDSIHDCGQALMKEALALIKQQDEQIFQLENRLKECENGYAGTLHIESCKLHDAEERVKELTEKVEAYRQELGKVRVDLNNANVDNKRLTEENERLSTALANYDRQTEVRIAEEYYTAEAYDELREENERLKKDNEYILMQHAFQRRPSGDCWNDVIEKAKSNTVREIFKEIYSSLDYIEEQMEPEEIPECFFSVREDINALKEKFESEGRGE